VGLILYFRVYIILIRLRIILWKIFLYVSLHFFFGYNLIFNMFLTYGFGLIFFYEYFCLLRLLFL